MSFVGDRMGNPGYKIKKTELKIPKSMVHPELVLKMQSSFLFIVSIYHTQREDIQHFFQSGESQLKYLCHVPKGCFKDHFLKIQKKKSFLKYIIMLSTHQVGEAFNNSLAIIHHQNSEFYIMKIHDISMKDILQSCERRIKKPKYYLQLSY